MNTWDIVVVGAGPGGALAALEGARRGASVLLVDRQPFPRRKVCGACLSPGALAALEHSGLGDLPARLGAVPLARLVLTSGLRRASVTLNGSMALSRAAFDQALVRAAVAAGVDFRDGGRATLGDVARGFRSVWVSYAEEEVEHRASVVIDASGLGAGLSCRRGVRDAFPVARSVGRGPLVSEDSRIGVGATFDIPGYSVSRGDLHMVVGSRGYVGLVRVEDGRLNVAAALDPDAVRESSPGAAIAEILSDAGHDALPHAPEDGWKGTPRLTRRPASVGAERVLRLGDAAGYVEPFTGEGICWALSSALAVAGVARRAALEWRPEWVGHWSEYVHRRVGRQQRLCRLLAWSLRRPRLVRGAVRVLARAPGLAAPLVREAARRPPSLVAGIA